MNPSTDIFKSNKNKFLLCNQIRIIRDHVSTVIDMAKFCHSPTIVRSGIIWIAIFIPESMFSELLWILLAALLVHHAFGFGFDITTGTMKHASGNSFIQQCFGISLVLVLGH
jgi:hypothetical protein